jgi:selenide,water dikinase
VLDKIAPGASDALILGFETSDDAAVYRMSDDVAALLTVDFFTPIVDDPYDFGRITAANALSDIYAMGGKPLTAMNLLAFPCSLGPDIVGEVVRGGAEKVTEAGAVTVGGHTIDDKEPKFGLSVFGVVHPDDVVRNRGARPGDAIFLTKPIGTGVWGTALKRQLVEEEDAREVIESMAALNRGACEAMMEVGVHAATDVTGFGLLGHLHELAEARGCGADVDLGAVPVFDGTFDFVRESVVPGRTAEIVSWANGFVKWHSPEDRELWMKLLCDPQTSGGLLIAVSDEAADQLKIELEVRAIEAAQLGRFTAGEPGILTIR